MTYAIFGRNEGGKHLKFGTCSQENWNNHGLLIVPLPHWLIQSWFHRRILRTIAERITMRAILDAGVHLTAIATVVLTVLTLPTHYESHGWTLVLFLIALSGLRWILAFSSSRSPHSMHSEVVKGFFGLLHENVFLNSPDFRFTYFVRDPIARVRVHESDDGHGRRVTDDILVPIIRKPNDRAAEEVRSKTYFPISSNSVAAQAWRNAISAKSNLASGNFEALINEFPGFRTREEMEDYYENTLRMDRKIVSCISSNMFGVVQIFSFPLADNDGNVLGLVSIDSKQKIRTEADSENFEGSAMTIDSVKLVTYLESMQTALARMGARSS